LTADHDSLLDDSKASQSFLRGVEVCAKLRAAQNGGGRLKA
jgi:hypothetical protein